ncbi:MAG TPA: hypothetical protein V6C97_08395 [Oculatellaceae cyanobacterium]
MASNKLPFVSAHTIEHQKKIGLVVIDPDPWIAFLVVRLFTQKRYPRTNGERRRTALAPRVVASVVLKYYYRTLRHTANTENESFQSAAF